MSGRIINRRRHERFSLPPMYTAVTVQVIGEPKTRLSGHCYDISEGGVQFELDNPLPNGTPVQLTIELPRSGDASETRRDVRVIGNVVWKDESEPGPVRMAATFFRFSDAQDKDRLFKHISGGHLTRAA